MALRYSKLCDTNILAYLAYLTVNHGESNGESGAIGGNSEVVSGGDGAVGVRGNFGFLLGCAFGDGGKDRVNSVLAGYDTVDHRFDRLCGVFGEQGNTCNRFGGRVSVGDSIVRGYEGDAVDGFVPVSGVQAEENEKVLNGECEVGGVPGAFGKERVQVVGVNLERNRQRRVERKEKKKNKQARGVDSRNWRSSVPLELNDSWVARKNAENELATLKAKKDLEFQKSRDVEAESKRRRVAVMKNTERDKVAVEKAFATLKVTGNVPGFCATVVDSEVPGLSGGSGSGLSISPDSSISQSEIRAMVKENEDLKNENRRLKRTAKLEKANDYVEVAITNDGEEPSPSLQGDMDERSKKYQYEYAYEPGWINGKDVLMIKTVNHYGECDIY